MTSASCVRSKDRKCDAPTGIRVRSAATAEIAKQGIPEPYRSKIMLCQKRSPNGTVWNIYFATAQDASAALEAAKRQKSEQVTEHGVKYPRYDLITKGNMAWPGPLHLNRLPTVPSIDAVPLHQDRPTSVLANDAVAANQDRPSSPSSSGVAPHQQDRPLSRPANDADLVILRRSKRIVGHVNNAFLALCAGVEQKLNLGSRMCQEIDLALEFANEGAKRVLHDRMSVQNPNTLGAISVDGDEEKDAILYKGYRMFAEMRELVRKDMDEKEEELARIDELTEALAKLKASIENGTPDAEDRDREKVEEIINKCVFVDEE